MLLSIVKAIVDAVVECYLFPSCFQCFQNFDDITSLLSPILIIDSFDYLEVANCSTAASPFWCILVYYKVS
jgi:hypothetical protein